MSEALYIIWNQSKSAVIVAGYYMFIILYLRSLQLFNAAKEKPVICCSVDIYIIYIYMVQGTKYVYIYI